MIKPSLIIILILLMTNISGALPYQSGDFSPVNPNPNNQQCYDYAIMFAQDPNNTDWRVVSVSRNPDFSKSSHMLVYKMAEDNETIIFHDPYWTRLVGKNFTYNVNFDNRRDGNPHFSPAYYHDWPRDRTPWRWYKVIIPNFEKIYGVAMT